ncbi:UbiA family prenyltransferase [Nocardioides sp.]|uniref:UbiA family prenyltransferase n=1 Tax=Nocardioides sp. TaxID=35761 RepID=UPI00286B4D3F|nr:UbiA family prenyltransferase [Nocardioides sp.]
MAKTQRWKSRRSAGEGLVPETGDSTNGGEVSRGGDTVLTEVPSDDEALAPPVTTAPDPQRRAAGRLGLRDRMPVLLLQAAHPRQAVLTAVGLAAAAALSGRPTREVAVVLATVLVGQVILGWHNDLVDRRRDARHEQPGKPLATERLDPGTAWFALTCGVLLVVPLSITSGITAGSAYLLSLVVGLLGNVVLRKGKLSWLPWAVSFGLFPAYLSYGGWGGAFEGTPPTWQMTALFALLGVGVHVLRALWGLVADNEDGWTYLPLTLGLRLGATRLLALAGVYTSVVLVLMAFTATYVGLRQ